MAGSIEVTCTWRDNGCSGIEIDQSSMPLQEGDKFVLNDGSTLKIPIGRAVLRFPPDGKEYEFIGPAILRVGTQLGELQGACRFKLIVGSVWAFFSDKPFLDKTPNAVVGVRG